MEESNKDILREALTSHQHGRLEHADELYRAVLEMQPDNADALHLSGVLAMQTGDCSVAVERIMRAIALAPNPDFYSHLGEAYRRLGESERAIRACRSALQLDRHHADAMNNLGVALLDTGNLDEAREVLARAIKLSPESASAHNNLGNVLRLLGDEDGALAEFRRAVEAVPSYAEAHLNLGQLLLERHELTAALEHCSRAVLLAPHLPQAHNNLGNALRESGRLEEAQHAYHEALRLDPQNGMVLGNIAQASQEEGRLDDALSWYNRALAADPSLVRTYNNLASCLSELDRTVEARTAFEEALRRDPKSPEANSGVASLLRDDGEYEQAIALLREVLAGKPDFSPAYAGLGQIYTELGRFTEAEQSLREAIRRDPTNGGAYGLLAGVLRRDLPDADLARMQLLLSNERRKGRMIPLHFALAQTLDARADFGDAAAHAAKGNALQSELWTKQGRAYDPPGHRAYVNQLCATFTQPFFDRRVDLGSPSELPVFIIGMPRSGTTLVEQILSSHSQVHGAGELSLVGRCVEALPKLCGVDAPPLDCLTRLDSKIIREAAQQYLDNLPRPPSSRPRITDKMPDNYLQVGLIHLMFPRARIIHCRRDLRDVAVSCWLTNFRSIRWASKEEDLAERIEQYLRITDHWRQVLPNRMFEVQYEDLIANPEAGTRRLIDWLGLDWEDACLQFHENSRPVRTASVVQVREPVYRRSAGRFQNYQSALRSIFNRLPDASS